MAGHEKEDIRLWTGGGDIAYVTKWLQVVHDVQSASLVNQTSVQSRNKIGR